MSRQRVDASSLLEEATALHERGDLPAATSRYESVLAAEPQHADALFRLGRAYCQQERFSEGVQLFSRLLALEPLHVRALNLLGMALERLDRADEALQNYDQAIAADPSSADAFANRGEALSSLGRFAEAVESYDRAVALDPGNATAWCNRGIALQQSGRAEEAVASFRRAVAAQPADRGAQLNLGMALLSQNRHTDAAHAYQAAVARIPNDAELHYRLGLSFAALDRFADAVPHYERALAIDPTRAAAHHRLGNAFRQLKRGREAAEHYRKALAIEPTRDHSLTSLVAALLADCDWSDYAGLAGEITRQVRSSDTVLQSFGLLMISDDPEVHHLAAARDVRKRFPNPAPAPAVRAHSDGRIRVAYVSSDFRRHPTSALIGELLESHDRRRFEVIGVSIGPDDGSSVRQRIAKAVDSFHDIRERSLDESVALVRELGVQIAVDLNGLTRLGRLGLFARRAAPIQVAYLGYPGTSGASFIDYILADPIVAPFDQQPYFTEKIVHLPDSYQVNDRQRPVASRTPSRREEGLPQRGFVFCCFNHTGKLNPPVFDMWMELLREVPESVLWLLRGSDLSVANLRREAAARGIDSARIVFAERVEIPEHLARHRIADLFLDTLPYNAHTTASDALWAGLPVLTCKGNAFAGRVAASLLTAAGVPELITNTPQEYRSLAVRLARDQDLLGSLREKIAANRPTCALFDTGRFRRHIEAAYETMWERYRRGDPPVQFAVTPQ